MANSVLGDDTFLGRWEPAGKRKASCFVRRLDIIRAMRLLAVIQVGTALWKIVSLANEMSNVSTSTQACVEYGPEWDDGDRLADDEHDNSCWISSLELDLSGMGDSAIEAGLAAWVLWGIKNADPQMLHQFSFAQFLLACKALITCFVLICYGISVIVGMHGGAAKTAAGLATLTGGIFQLYSASYMLYYAYTAWSYAKTHDISDDLAPMYQSSTGDDSEVSLGAVGTVNGMMSEIVTQRTPDGAGSTDL